MKKEELKKALSEGKTMNDLFAFRPGQECDIFKAGKFEVSDEIAYIPDIYLNEIPVDRPLKSQEEIDEVLGCCYTGQDFVDECDGDVEKAEVLFDLCDWQHPSSAHMDLMLDEEDE